MINTTINVKSCELVQDKGTLGLEGSFELIAANGVRLASQSYSSKTESYSSATTFLFSTETYEVARQLEEYVVRDIKRAFGMEG